MQRERTSWQSPEPFLLTLIKGNLPLVLFLAISLAGMFAVYWFYAAPDERFTDAVAAASGVDEPSAAIHKQLPARPVRQRFAQTPGPLHIALIAGHMNHDSGAVCDDGLTEADVNLKVAHGVAEKLRARGVDTEILAEFDPRLQGYTGTALVSIHADSCDDINDLATGFKISGSPFTDSTQLSVCMENEYQVQTKLPFHANTITDDMRNYHAFREIAAGVPAIIIETGFMNRDRELLTANADVPVTGIVNGIVCFLATRQSVAEGSAP